jgi:hypothetical protein
MVRAMSGIFTRSFWIATAERAVKTFAECALAVYLVGDKLINAFNVDWSEAFGVGLGGAVGSVLLSVASSGVGSSGGPSLVSSETLDYEPEHRRDV